DNAGSQLTEYSRGNLIGRSVGTVEHNFQPTQVQRIGGAFAEFNIATGRIVNAFGLTQLGRIDTGHGFIQPGFDGQLGFIGQFLTGKAEYLNAVMVVRLVRGTDCNSGRNTECAVQVSNAWRRKRPQQPYTDTGGDQAGFQGRLTH